MAPRARGIGWTATPIRADRRPLARAAGGCYDELIQGPTTAELVTRGWLASVEAYSLPQAFDRSQIPLSPATGDFKAAGLRTVTRSSPIVGDIVEHYLRLARGMRGLTFCVDIEHAERQAAAYRAAGVQAEAISSETPDEDRENVFEAFATGRLMQICNVDIFGEGTDCPEIGVVSCGRATESLPLFYQQIGRVRRPAPGKRCGLLLDHVGNLLVHGLPDGVEAWSLDGEPRRSGGGPRGVPVRQCRRPGCWRAFEGWTIRCPYCGWKPEAAPARQPEEVEGELALYGPELRTELMRRAAAAVAPPPGGRPETARDAVIRRHMAERATAQTELRESMAWWAGIQQFTRGLDVGALQRLFNATFGVCVLGAQGLGGPEARKLTEQVWKDVGI
jgi:superfamily II DNA or RNA helicase